MEEIKLTEKEKELCEFLLETINDYNENTVLRIAGGWVRDKLMGKESDDIDISLDNMHGGEFAEMLSQKAFKEDLAAGKIHPSFL